MISVTFLMVIALLIVIGITNPVARQIRTVYGLHLSRQSYFTAEADSEDSYYRIKNNYTSSFPKSMTLGSATTTTSLVVTGSGEEEITTEGNASNYIRKVYKSLTATDGYSFNYGVQSGLGGLSMSNNSVVLGNIYVNGTVTGSNNVVTGSVVSAGPSGSVTGIHATSSMYAHTITNSTVDGDAYYQTLTSTTVTGTKHPGSTDQPLISLPISDTLVAQWESDAAAGGSVTCTSGSYTISSNVTIGPKKIPCNLIISGNGTTVTLTGSVWATGNITISGTGGTGILMKVADSIGNKSIAMIAENSSAPTTSSLITASGNSNFYGSTGNTGSYVMLISMNTSAEQSGSVVAVDISNGAAGNILVYAPHGQIKLSNNVTLRELTAYKLTLINNSEVIYNIGLAQSIFTSGPGGSWKIKKWREKI